MFMAAFPDIQFVADEMIAERDKVSVRGTVSGTHKGEFMGIPPTNKSFEVQFMDIIEIPRRQGDGALGSHRSGSDDGTARDRTRDVIDPEKRD